jgi:hypothetical protein
MQMIATAGAGAVFAQEQICPCGSARLVRDCHGLAQPPDGAVAILGGQGPQVPGARAWTGEARRGERLVVVLDAGAGDAIHAMRHVPAVEAHGPVTWVVRPGLERLFRASFPRSDVVTHYPLPRAEWRIGTLDLITLNPPAARAPYLKAPAPQEFKRDGQLRVGMCVRGDKTQAFDRWRSIHDSAVLDPLFCISGIDWYDLAAGPFGDWADTADLVAGLDLVVSVDTGVAHLAGALGRPLLLLNRAPGYGDPGPDDRWQEGWLQPGPLYPGTRVIQQRHRGNWAPVIRQAAAIVAATRKNTSRA